MLITKNKNKNDLSKNLKIKAIGNASSLTFGPPGHWTEFVPSQGFISHKYKNWDD